MSSWSDDENVSSTSRRGKRPHRIESSSSEDDSDGPQVKSFKRKKPPVLESNSEDSSDSSPLLPNRNFRQKKKMPRVESDESSSDDESAVTGRLGGRVARLESDESTGTSQSSEEATSESGQSSGESSESGESYISDDEVMVQTAIQESLANLEQEQKVKQTESPKSKKTPVPSTSAGFTSDSSDGQSEKCPICLLSFTDQEIGSPETCDHIFCAVCIQEWAKNVNTCPVDRQVFSLILVRKCINGKVIRKVPVEHREARDTPEESEMDPTFCEICGLSDREDRMLLCDGCDMGYHLECLNPPMENVPVDEWFCPDCSNDTQLAEVVEIEEGEVYDLLDDYVQAIRPRTSRLLPRTRQSERVRATVRELHQERLRRSQNEPAWQQPTTSGIESMGADSSSVTSGRRTSISISSTQQRKRKVVKRKKIVKRRKKRIKRKTVKRKTKTVKKNVGVKGTDCSEEEEEDEDDYTPKTKRKRRRRRRKRKTGIKKKKVFRRRTARTARVVVPKTVKGRLAEQLGLCAPKRPGVSVPVVRSRLTASDIDTQRSRAGIPILHLFGQQNQLDYFSDSEEEVVESGGLAVAARPRNIHSSSSRLLAKKKILSAAALQSHSAVTRATIKNNVKREENTSVNETIDLVGSILNSQTIWHSKTPSVTIRPDGSLEMKKELQGTKKTNIQKIPAHSIESENNESGNNLLRGDNRLQEVSGGNTPLDVNSASGRTTQTPMYPGRGGNNNRPPPPGASFHQFGGNRYSGSSYQNYQGGRSFSNYSSSSNFDANSTRASYSNYLNSGLPPQPFRNNPVRFRVTPRYPSRRQGPHRQQNTSPKTDEKKADDNGESSQKQEDEEDDEIDIYSDIETGGGGSGGPSGGGSEPDDAERCLDTGYEALPPPPEPSALLMGLGEQALSDEDPTSDSELVIDDNVGLSSPHDHNETTPLIPESEKYDPAEPSKGSDEEDTPVPSPKSTVQNEDIPLPPSLPTVNFPSNTNVPPHIINSSSNSNASYLHSPTYGDASSFETDKLSSVTSDGVVSKVVKEVIKEHLSSTANLINVVSPKHLSHRDTSDECPNFSIYSATSMDIARKTEEEQMKLDIKDNDDKLNAKSDHEDKKTDEDIDSKTEIDSSLEDNIQDVGDTFKESSVLPERKDEDEMKEENDTWEKSEVEESSSSENLPIPLIRMEETESEQKPGDTADEIEGCEEIEEQDITNTEHHAGDTEQELKVKDQEPDMKEGETKMKEEQEHDIQKNLESSIKEQSDFETENEEKEEEHITQEDGVCLERNSQERDDIDEKPVNDDQEQPTDESKILEEKIMADIPTGAVSTSFVADKPSDSRKVSESKSEDIPVIEAETTKDDALESDDNESLIGGATSALSVTTVDNPPVPSAPSGLEGLETETISETEEAINFDDISQDGNEMVSAEEDGEISSGKKKRKKKSRRNVDPDGKEMSELSGELISELMIEKERTPPEEGEIVDDRPKIHELSKKEKKSTEKKEKPRHEKEASKVSDENFDISKSKDDDKKKKKRDKQKSSEKAADRSVLSSSENKQVGKEKQRKSEDTNISWKKPSKNTKERNYRDGKGARPEDVAKERDEREEENRDTQTKKKKKEKRKDMERYDVRKIVSDKRRRRKDEFGRDLSRDRTCSRSRSRSYRRSRDRSRQRSRSRSRSVSRGRNRSRHRSPIRSRRSRSRSRYRSRSRSYRRSRSKSKTRAKRRSKDRVRRSRSKERLRIRTRSRSRGRRSRSRSRSRSRQKNKTRQRTRSRSPVKTRDRKERGHMVRDTQRFHTRRSWSRTWTPSWSRSRSRSLSCSSFTQSRSPSVNRFRRSYTRSFSRSWSRERYERIPLEKTGTLSNKTAKKLTVIVSNTKEGSERQKKEKKKKKDRKNKDAMITVEKRKKRKEKSPAPSKEVFTSGDNILVSVNFNKSSKSTASKDVSSSALQKDSNKRKRDDTFEGEREIGKKLRKEKQKDKNKSLNDKNAMLPPPEKKSKKQLGKGPKSARLAAAMKQKPVAIIDLDQSPFREQTPSPRDLIILSDSDDEPRSKDVGREETESLTVRRTIRPSASPQAPNKGVHSVSATIVGTRTPESELPLMSAVSNYLITSTGPKTPPEPQVKFSIATKQPQLRVINNPLQEDDDISPEDGVLDDSDQRIEEELDRSLVDIVHKGPNTPPEPRGPTTPCSPPTSPDAYDPFDPTKSGTPSPAGPEASMDGPPSPPRTPNEELLQHGTAGVTVTRDSPMPCNLEDMVSKNVEALAKTPSLQPNEEVTEEPCESPDRTNSTARNDTVLAKSPVGKSETISVPTQLPNEELSQATEIPEGSKASHGLPSNITSATVSESSLKSPERKILSTSQSKLQTTPVKPQVFPMPTLKQIPTSQQSVTSTPSHSNAPAPLFPALTPVNIASILCTSPASLGLSRTNLFTTPTSLSVPTLLHVANSTPLVSTRLPQEKTPSSSLPIRALVQNGEQMPKQPPDTITEAIDMDIDSPYSPGSSEGDDLFDPPADTPTRLAHPSDRSKPTQTVKGTNKLTVPMANLPAHKSPSKPQEKFDSLFGKGSAPVIPATTVPVKRAKAHKGAKTKTKHMKGGRKEIAIKMDEDQLQILDELPSSAVEMQVKDKYLKKLNRQERVVDEVKLSLKPHYNRKHITKEEYKDILRKSVPKICHNRSGEINPIKIASLVEAYVRKVRYEKKKNALLASASASAAPSAKAKVISWTYHHVNSM